MIYVIGQYWDFLLLAVIVGIPVGWWAQSAARLARRAARPSSTSPAEHEGGA